jgi:hypothetical protein
LFAGNGGDVLAVAIRTGPAPSIADGVSLPAGTNPVVWDGGSGGLNTESTRPGIKDQEAAWLDGFMPIGEGNVRTLPGLSAPLFAAATAGSIVEFGTCIVGGVSYIIVWLANGSIVAVNITTLASATIAPNGTVAAPRRGAMGLTQWGGQFVVFVANQTNGYWVWDGTTFYVPGATVTNAPGTSGPSVTFQGYIAGTVLTVVGVSSGALTSGMVLATPAAAGTTIVTYGTGVGGTGTYNVSISQTVGTAGAPATFTGTDFLSGIVPTGVHGTDVEIYANRVWIVDGANVHYSSPGSLTDFNAANGAGSFSSADSFLRTNFSTLRQTNGFLYLIGDSSINYISGVSTQGTPTLTTFTNQNADPELGTPFDDAVDVFSRNVIFGNTFGVHVSYGGAVVKISDMLDGIYTTAPTAMLSQRPSSAKAIVFGKKIWMTLVPIVDPFTGATENKLLCWTAGQAGGSGRWFTSSQDFPLTFIRGFEIASALLAFGTDGSKIWQLFANPSSGFTKVAQSRLWAAPGGIATSKTTNRVWGIVSYGSTVAQALTVSLDSGMASYPSGSTATIAGPGVVGPYVFPPQGLAAANGTLLGMTVQTTAADLTIVALAMDIEDFGYRG